MVSGSCAIIQIAGVENGNEFIIGVDAHNPDEYHDLASYKGCIKMAEDFGGKVFWK